MIRRISCSIVRKSQIERCHEAQQDRDAEKIQMELPNHAWDESILVVAHPDDEVLWFSSILDKVEKIIICFVDAERHSELGAARRLSLKHHDFRDRIISLDLSQSKSHNMSQWPEPEETGYGLRLNKDLGLDELHQEQASRVNTALAPHIEGAKNIYTHNPWGEYGHEDHVQINKLVTRLAQDAGATVWFDNYVSNKSSLLMRSYMRGFGKPYYTMPVDAERARQIADTYYRHGAWTWVDDYVWFSSESFVQGPLEGQPQPCAGALFPVNYIRVPFDPLRANAPAPGPFTRIRRKLKRGLGLQKRYCADAATN